MINIIWAAMIITGVVVSFFTGNIEDVNTGIISSGEEAVSLCITMLGVTGMWSGIMNIAKKSGLMEKWSDKMVPIMKILFPNVPKNNPAYEYMCTNIIANMAGLGWAATPPALKAMRELSILNNHKKKASRDMCTFLIINISSIQLVPVNIIAYRAKYGAENPAAIILPGFIATLCSTVTAVLLCLIINNVSKKKKETNKRISEL